MARLTIHIDDELHYNLKNHCVSIKETMQQFVIKAVNDKLEKDKQ